MILESLIGRLLTPLKSLQIESVIRFACESFILENNSTVSFCIQSHHTIYTSWE